MKKLSNQGGFTLIEALTAVFILGVGIIALYTLQMTGVRGNFDAQMRTQAIAVAGDVLEQLAQQEFTDGVFDYNSGKAHKSSELTAPAITLPPAVENVGADAVSWTVSKDWGSDGEDNDGDGATDEADEAGMKKIELTVKYKMVANMIARQKKVTLKYLKVKFM